MLTITTSYLFKMCKYYFVVFYRHDTNGSRIFFGQNFLFVPFDCWMISSIIWCNVLRTWGGYAFFYWFINLFSSVWIKSKFLFTGASTKASFDSSMSWGPKLGIIPSMVDTTRWATEILTCSLDGSGMRVAEISTMDNNIYAKHINFSEIENDAFFIKINSDINSPFAPISVTGHLVLWNRAVYV